jgi:hypothetical protein
VTVEPERETDWSFPDTEARTLAIAWLLAPYAAAAFFFGFATSGWWTIPSGLAGAACALVARRVIGLARKRRGVALWRGASRNEDIEAARAAFLHLGWSSSAIVTGVRWLGWALVAGGALAAARSVIM